MHKNNKNKINNFVYLSESTIHNKGVFALKTIPFRTKIIQYKGELISKEEGTRREETSIELSQKAPSKGVIYIMEIDEENDIDGDIEDNYAKYINHSCDPNCTFEIEKKEIWIYSKKEITNDQEITCDYGFDFDPKNPLRHPCKCKSKNCPGYIVEKEQRSTLVFYQLAKVEKQFLKNILSEL